MSDPTNDTNFWQWVAQGVTVCLVFVGGLVMKDWKDRMQKMEEAHKNLVTSRRLDEVMKVQTDERRWMHEQNADRFEELNKRLDRFLDRE
jgi:hypothetical protein